MKTPFLVSLLVCSLLFNEAWAHKCEQGDRELWSVSREYKRTMAIVGSLFQCLDRSDKENYQVQDRQQCYWFTGRAVDSLYGVGAFRDGDGYLSSSAMAQKLHAGDIEGWHSIGPASSQDTLREAAKLSRRQQPVLAAWLGEHGQGQVSLILPGGLAYSSSWALEVPNAANISLGAVNNSFYGCRLSYALSKDKRNNTQLFAPVPPE